MDRWQARVFSPWTFLVVGVGCGAAALGNASHAYGDASYAMNSQVWGLLAAGFVAGSAFLARRS
jgi:hypothetical protein